jgi:hypothetical protein
MKNIIKIFIKNDKLSEDFYQWISAIILLLSAILSYNCLFISVPPLGGEGLDGVNYNLDFNLGIGIYSGLFHITSIYVGTTFVVVLLHNKYNRLFHMINLTFFNLKYYVNTTIFKLSNE